MQLGVEPGEQPQPPLAVSVGQLGVQLIGVPLTPFWNVQTGFTQCCGGVLGPAEQLPDDVLPFLSVQVTLAPQKPTALQNLHSDCWQQQQQPQMPVHELQSQEL